MLLVIFSVIQFTVTRMCSLVPNTFSESLWNIILKTRWWQSDQNRALYPIWHGQPIPLAKESADHVILGSTFDAQMQVQLRKNSEEKHLRSVSSAAAQRLGVMRKSWQVFHDRSLLLRSICIFVLTVLEYCSAVWCSTADLLLERVVRGAVFLAGDVLKCNLAHRRSVGELCILFKIKSNPMHPLSCTLPLPHVVLWFLKGTCLRLLAAKLLSTLEPLCPSQCLFVTILVAVYLMV